MNTNERLTEAARRGARGETSSGGFATLSAEKQKMATEYVMGNSALAEEVITASLNAMSPADLEDLFNEMGDTTKSEPAPKTFHSGGAE